MAGFSAGGYIGRLAALYAEPRPRAFASLYGMGGNWLLDHWLDNSKTKAGLSPMISASSKEDVAHLNGAEPIAEVPIFIDPSSGAIADDQHRGKLFGFWHQNGDFLDHLTDHYGLSQRLRSLPYDQRESAIPERVASLFPQLHIDEEFPPTMLLHGDEDTVISKAESVYTYEQLQQAGVSSQLYIVPGAEHGLMMATEMKRAPETEELFPKAFDFLVAAIL